MPFLTTRRVEFSDTDAAGIVHFARFFVFMESAEHEMLRSVGLSVLQAEGEHHISWPRVAVQCEYQRSAEFEDLLTVETVVERIGEKSITYSFRFLRVEELLATGKTTAVCCRIERGQPPRSIPIPAPIRAKLEQLPHS